MAAASYYSGAPVGDEASDLGLMWQQALDEYASESGGKDLRGTDSSQWNMGRILGDQEEQLQLFGVFRHDKGRVDKLRSLVSKNSQIIQSVASNIANAASSAFPPSTAILTAFNYVMTASKAVSDDYDMIVQFFDIVNSFLERVSMLEGRIPDMRPFQLHLMKVFKSLLVLCAIARRYRTTQGRLKKWAKALVDGSDGKLQGAFQGLHTQLERFEAATQIATLRTAIDSSRKLDSYGKELKAIQAGVSQTIELGHQGVAVGEQNFAQGQQILAMEEHTFSIALVGKGFAQDAAMSSKEILEVVTRHETTESEQTDMMKRFESKLDRTMKSQQPKNKSGGDLEIDAGARKSGALKNLEQKLRDDTKSQLMDLESNYVHGTFEWLVKSMIYQDLEVGISQIVHLTGPPGMGKSMITYATASALKEHFDGDSETSVAFFFFRTDDDDEARSAESMLKSCAYQVAAHNIKYREEVNAELKRDESRWIKEASNAKALWRRLFTSKFTKAGRKVILLLDGVDEAEDDAVKRIIDIIKKLPTTEANIRIMFSTNAAVSDELGFGQIEATKFTLDKKMVVEDMKLVAMARMKRLSRLSKLRLPTKKRIARNLCKKADSIRYIDHMLRRLNAIGQEAPILKELKKLPDNTVMLYGMLLEDCQRDRTDADRDLLRRLFAWIAYSRERLHMGSARRLLEYIAKDNRIVVDEEIEHKSARILRLSNSTWADSYETYESDHETDRGEDDAKSDNDENTYEDMDVYLSFQERSLREYFRENEPNVDSLRSAPSIGNMMMFEAIAAILTSPLNRSKTSSAEWELQRYCRSHWMKHLQDIKCDELDDDQAANVINSLYAILSNRDNSLRVFEQNWRLDGYTIFGTSEEQEKRALDELHEWASRAIRIRSSALTPGATDWMRPLIRHQDIIYIRLAEAHVANWFLGAQDSRDAYRSFLFAHASLEHGRDMLKHRPDLLNYFEERSKAGHIREENITAESISIVSKSSWQMEMIMTSQSYRAIGMAMLDQDFREPSLEYFELSLQNADDSRDKIFVYSRMAEALVELAHLAATREEEANPAKNMNVGAPGPKTDAIDRKEEVEDQHCGESGASNSKTCSTSHDASEIDALPNNTDETRKVETSSKEWIQRALDCIYSAQEVIPKLEYAGDPDSDRELQNAIRSVHVQLARVELLQGDTKNLISHLTEAMEVSKGGGEIIYLYLLQIPEICKQLAKKEQWATIMDIFSLLSKEDRFYFLWDDETEDPLLRKAGKITNQCQLVASTYKDGIRMLQAWEAMDLVNQFLLYLAEFHRTVVGGPEALAEAKIILNKVINTPNDSQIISKASFQIADILVEEFRATRDPFRKIVAQSDMKALVSKVRENMSIDFDATQSQTTIPLAYMTRKLAAFEFQEKLRETFFGCYDLLRDETIGNDSQSLRMLAKVLAYVPGLEHDAEIAASCQLYVVDKEVQKKEMALEESEHESDNEDDKQVEKSGKNEAETEEKTTTTAEPKYVAGVNGINGVDKGANGHAEEESDKPVDVNVAETKLTNVHEETDEIDEKPKDKSKEAEIKEKLKEGEKNSQENSNDVNDKPKEDDGDLDEIHGIISCKNCKKFVTNWNSGAVYLCYYCTEMDLCEECYVAKKKRESGELPADWRTLCPSGHKHIKAPAPGWKGIKDGVIRFEVEENNMRFETWLNELKHSKWNAAWETFWSKEMQE